MSRAPSTPRSRTLAVALALGASGCIGTAFVDATYPADAPPPAAPDARQALDAALLPTLLDAYRDAPAAGACLGATLAAPAHRAALWRHGQCRAAGGSLVACLGELPWFEPDGARWRLALPCPGPPTGDDAVTLGHALATAGALLVAFEGEALGPRAGALPMDPATDARLAQVADHAARVLGADPRRDRQPELPALALSGGAANGAFVAGFLHALLWLREKGLANASPEQRALIEGYRFGSTHGTSVGALLALPLDLYFTEGPPHPADGPALDACLAGMPRVSGDPRRAYQDCALAHLARDFVQDEWALLCAQPGTVLALLGDDAHSLLRFDPLERGLIGPFLASFGPRLAGNAFLRDAVTVDLEHTAVVGLDERACALPGMPAACQREALMASLSEPLFTPARPRVWSGLDGPAGERGSWYDGGVGSVNPVTLAVRATRGRVLALDTFRAHGTPAPAFLGQPGPPSAASPGPGLGGVAMSMITALGTSLIRWEAEAGARLGRERSAERCLLEAALAAPGAAVDCRPDAAPVLRVSVPVDVAPRVLFASGYAFDPVVMGGLHAWGRAALLRSRFQVLEHLGWCALGALETDAVECPGGEGTSAAQRAVLARVSAEVAAEIRGLARWARPGAWQRHLDHRRRLVGARLGTCRDG